MLCSLSLSLSLSVSSVSKTVFVFIALNRLIDISCCSIGSGMID